MIDKEGFYFDQFKRVWEFKGRLEPLVSLRLFNTEKKVGFYSKTGECIGTTNITVIKEYLNPEKYPEYYI